MEIISLKLHIPILFMTKRGIKYNSKNWTWLNLENMILLWYTNKVNYKQLKLYYKTQPRVLVQTCRIQVRIWLEPMFVGYASLGNNAWAKWPRLQNPYIIDKPGRDQFHCWTYDTVFLLLNPDYSHCFKNVLCLIQIFKSHVFSQNT